MTNLDHTDDPMVISGFAVEAPGGIETLDDYWQALAAGDDLIGPFPRDRDWDLDELQRQVHEQGWRAVPDAGGFLSGATEFDPQFFGISPREAVAMDPQQRVVLRVAWRALEHAGIDPQSLTGQDVGVFIGGSVTEYGPRADEANEYTGYRGAGTALGALAGRISHCLQLVGPSMTVDTACASSLSALDLAVKSVAAGESDLALAGGVCVMGSLGAFYEFAKNGALSSDGQCRPYSSDADGTLWGEGAGVFVVERESAARAAHRQVYARVRAVGVNHNGGGPGIAVPSASAQSRLIAKTVARSGVSPAQIGMIEGHGTGTAVGDPLELEALTEVYGADSPASVGSVKSNLGHAQAGSGALGLAKVVLAGWHGQIPPTRHADRPTDAVDWNSSALRLADSLTEWSADSARYAAVSSFGIAGTNAHAIVEMPVRQSAQTRRSA